MDAAHPTIAFELNMNLEPMAFRERLIKMNRRVATTAISPTDSAEAKQLKRASYPVVRGYLNWVDTNLVITPLIKNVTGLNKAFLKVLSGTGEYPADIVATARALYNRFEAEEWGRNAAEDSDDADEDPNAVPISAVTALNGPGPRLTTAAAYPAANDPIFGEQGPMYGVMLHISAKQKRYILNPKVEHKSFKVHGHNGIPLGKWFPYQVCALHFGAHGSSMGGISGNQVDGAWSIVVADHYDDLDRDEGDSLWYSGSNSHKNADPDRPAQSTSGTKALKTSYFTGQPVRVLRSGGQTGYRQGNNTWLPSRGLRYDGLYQVMFQRDQTNLRGGLYEQFKLERLPGQTPLDVLARDCPNRRELDQMRLLSH